jgi:chromate transporter
MAVYVGYTEAGLLGAMAALAGVVLPSVVLMVAISTVLIRYREHPVIAAALRGVKPAVVGMLAFVAWDLAPTGVQGIGTAAVAVLAFAALVVKVHPAIVMAAAMGIGIGFLRGV